MFVVAHLCKLDVSHKETDSTSLDSNTGFRLSQD